MIAIGAFLSAAVVITTIRACHCAAAIRFELERRALARELASQLRRYRHGQ